MTTLLKSAKPLNAGVTLPDLASFEILTAGTFRRVFTSPLFPNVVLKVPREDEQDEYDDGTGASASLLHQIEEIETWARLCQDGYEHFVPHHDIIQAEDQIFLVVELIEFTHESRHISSACNEMAVAYRYTNDARKAVNVGFTSNGRFIIRDAGDPAFF